MSIGKFEGIQKQVKSAKCPGAMSTVRMVRWLGFILEEVVDIKSNFFFKKKPSAGQSGLLQLTIYAFWDVEDTAG